jgi:tripartite-type tricarboxylate transporter receptor subunit TctC
MVPYAGSAPAQQDVMAGRVDVTMDGLGTTMDRIKSGRYRALAVSGEKRYFELPDHPTFKEGGINMTQMVWIGIFAPKGTPKDVVEKINKAVGIGTDSPRFQDWVSKAGGGTAKPPVAESKKVYEDDRAVWRDITTALGLNAK